MLQYNIDILDLFSACGEKTVRAWKVDSAKK